MDLIKKIYYNFYCILKSYKIYKGITGVTARYEFGNPMNKAKLGLIGISLLDYMVNLIKNKYLIYLPKIKVI
jgi:hypothetical protein